MTSDSRSVAEKLGTSGGTLGGVHVCSRLGVLSGLHVPTGNLGSGAAFDTPGHGSWNGPLRTIVHRRRSSRVASGVGVQRTLLGPRVAFLGIEVNSCLLERCSKEELWDRVVVALAWVRRRVVVVFGLWDTICGHTAGSNLGRT